MAGCIAVAVGLWVSPGSALAAVPFVDIGTPSGPLTQVAVGNDLSCQAKHTGDTSNEFFPSSATPGDCGTFIAVGGALFGPDFANHDSSATSNVRTGAYTPFSAVSQTPRSGAGTSANPFRVVTAANAGSTGLAIAQVDSYVTGQESYRTDIAVRNGGGAPQSIVIYRAGDCYLQNSDTGFGFTGQNNSAGCSANANNIPPGRIEEFLPITPGASYMEDRYSEVWSRIGAQMPFTNQCNQCTTNTDNGAGISWSATIQPGQTVTFSHFTTFSPTGRTGPPPAPPPTESTDVAAARTPTCLSIPGVVRNRIARVRGVGTVVLRTLQVDNPVRPLRLSISLAGRGSVASVTFQINGRTVVVTRGRSTTIPVTFLRIGSRFRNKITAVVVLSTGRSVALIQRMVILRCNVPAAACQRLGDGRRLRCRSRTPLGGRRVRVTVTRSAAETAKGGPAVVRRGRYTVVVTSRTALAPGTYAYKAVVRTNRRGERFQMIRLVTVR